MNKDVTFYRTDVDYPVFKIQDDDGRLHIRMRYQNISFAYESKKDTLKDIAEFLKNSIDISIKLFIKEHPEFKEKKIKEFLHE